jgi:hypothetical protein
VNCGKLRGPPQVPPLRYPGFPVEIGGVGELHAAFFTESRTRGHVQRSVAGNPGALRLIAYRNSTHSYALDNTFRFIDGMTKVRVALPLSMGGGWALRHSGMAHGPETSSAFRAGSPCFCNHVPCGEKQCPVKNPQSVVAPRGEHQYGHGERQNRGSAEGYASALPSPADA